ncbi:adhesion G protein-coupled receptor L4-like [Dysidea avara]|uniref:adhesion G protein-coupled receptor L4-like n=1 Tax=Dysidea avara TaxID=196820 RepID=UPI00331CE9F6
MIHLNLSVALLFGLVVFVSGVDRAEHWWCNMVAILLHYFFLCVFCWTLCEAIMIYMMFVELFYKGIFQDMRFFLLLGWSLPIPIVAISAGLSYDNYVIDKNINTTSCMDEYNIDMEMDNTSASETEIIACWISDKDGSIWAFAGPVILILMINVTLFMLSLLSIIRSRRTHAKMTDTLKANYETAKILLSSTVVLLPLLGGTWLLGLLFVINNESVELAWIFTVVNSLQGVGIFFFQVVRNREVKNVIERKFKRWRKERKLKSSLKDTTTQKQIMKSNFTLQNKSTSMEETEYPSTKDSSHPQNQ